VDAKFFAERFETVLNTLQSSVGGLILTMPPALRRRLPPYRRLLRTIGECRDELQRAIDRVRERNARAGPGFVFAFVGCCVDD
jgi:hypothetical protein